MLSVVMIFSKSVGERARQVAVVASVALLVAVTAGCGGAKKGGGGKKGGGEPAAGSMVQGFKAQVISADSARLTADLARPVDSLTVAVRKLEGRKQIEAGEAQFGAKPKGPVSITWNLEVASRKLAPGRYRLVLRGQGAGRSKPALVTLP